ncbi:MAG TPA: lasso peptide biosynthesis B2 protein [Pyrinomonadaceae bacterium]|nr:lasso peptide biosynthesis B2 protein [Pyrinomonadaceae bacterium]
MGSIERFKRRKPGEVFLLLHMAGWVLLLSVLIKFFPLPKVLSLVAIPARGQKPKHPKFTQQRLAQLVDALLGLNFLCFTPTCWKRAPILHRYLALNGIETRIIFGLRKDKETPLAGHAWLEADGRPLLEATPPLYTPTYSFPA